MGLLRNVAGFGKQVSDGGRGVEAVDSEILAAGRRIIHSIRLTTGVGDPEDGRQFSESAERFRSAGRSLNTAIPGGNWDSAAAAAAYSDCRTASPYMKAVGGGSGSGRYEWDRGDC